MAARRGRHLTFKEMHSVFRVITDLQRIARLTAACEVKDGIEQCWIVVVAERRKSIPDQLRTKDLYLVELSS